MAYSHPYFLGSRTDFFLDPLDAQPFGKLIEGVSDGQEFSEVVATGKTSGDTAGQYFFKTTFFFTYDATHPQARVIVYGYQNFINNPGGFDWSQPQIVNPYPPGYDDSRFVVGSGYTNHPPVRAADGSTTFGSSIITSASAHFSVDDIGGTVYDSARAIPGAVQAVIQGVEGNQATLNVNCTADTSNNTFFITRSVQVPGVGAVYGYNRSNNRWLDSRIAIYAPLAKDRRDGHAFGIKGGKTRCSDMQDSQPLITTSAWGFPHADQDITFGIVMNHSQQYGWGVSLVSFLWVPTV